MRDCGSEGIPIANQANAVKTDIPVAGCQTCKLNFDRHIPFGEDLEVLHMTKMILRRT